MPELQSPEQGAHPFAPVTLSALLWATGGCACPWCQIPYLKITGASWVGWGSSQPERNTVGEGHVAVKHRGAGNR